MRYRIALLKTTAVVNPAKKEPRAPPLTASRVEHGSWQPIIERARGHRDIWRPPECFPIHASGWSPLDRAPARPTYLGGA
jgi:hypothetical protein